MANSSISDEEYSLRWPLHGLLRDYSSGEVDDDSRWFAKISELARNKNLANQVCGAGLLPFDLFSPAGNASWNKAPQAAALLVEVGVNPLLPTLKNGDPPLIDILRSASSGTVYEAMGAAMVEALVDRNESNDPLHAEDGGNLLHLLCQHQPSLLPGLLEYFKSGQRSCPLAWLNEPDRQGRVPLEGIWAPGRWWDATLDDIDPEQLDEEISHMLAATGAMVDAGAKLDITSSTGASLINLISDRVSTCPEALDQLEGSPLLSMLQHWKLDHEAPPATKRPLYAKRL